MNISITILTYNSERSLQETLDSLSHFSDVVILDSGSTDTTKKIALSYHNVRFYQHPFLGFGPMHNRASSLANFDWILSLDSDEVLPNTLIKEIESLSLSSSHVYRFARKNLYKGQHIRGCGWWPDQVVRLYNRTKTSFSEALVHEQVLTHDMIITDLKEPLIHVPFTSVAQFLSKIQSYSDLYAKQKMGKKWPSSASPYLHGLAAFWRSYLIKRGFLDGWKGIEISLYTALQSTYKYLKLIEKNREDR